MLAALADVATFLGFPLAVGVLFAGYFRERAVREEEIYRQLNERYVEYLALCRQHPEADLYYYRMSDAPDDEVTLLIRLTICETLITIFERAFLLYEGETRAFRKHQWSGWDAFMRDWAAKPRFRELWAVLGVQFDSRFVAYMDRVIHETSEAVAPPDRPITEAMGSLRP